MDDLIKILKKKGKTKKTTLKDIREFLKKKNQKAADRMLAKRKNPLIYAVKFIHEDEISYDLTILEPGKIGDEFYETKGHTHIKKTPEVYFLLEGKGHIIAKNFRTGRKKRFALKKGKFIYVSKEYGHRTVNTGRKKLIFVTVSQVDAGHDYNVSKRKGF